MRKIAQEKKKAAAATTVVLSPSSSSNCSLASNNPAIDSLPSVEIGEESFYDTGGHRVENTEEEEDYSMDDIWRDIDQTVCDDEKMMCNFSWAPVASPPWEYGQYPPWKVAEEENKAFAAMNIYDHGEAVALT